jgi:hypothetical protein
VDDTYAYWTEAGGKVLKRVLKSGGGETTLASNSFGFDKMVLDGNYLYYLDSGTKVQELPKSGGTPTTLATGNLYYGALTVRDNAVFWGASGVIYSVPTSGGPATTVATSSPDIVSIRVTNNVVFWSRQSNPGTVFMQGPGGTPSNLYNGNVNPGLEVRDGFVYFAVAESIYRVLTNGTSLQALATNLNNAYDLAIDETNIYWIESVRPNGSVKQMPRNGGPITVLATNLAEPSAIAIDSTNVYWLERNNGIPGTGTLKWAAKASSIVDVVPPSISIISPVDGAQVNASALSVNGTASDDTSVALVELRLNGGAWQAATGTTNWAGSVNLISGANTVDARSRDSALNYSPVASVAVTYDARLPQSITFGPLSHQLFGDAPFTLFASASSGLPISFSVLDGPAVLSGNIMTMTGPELVVVRASQSGDATYAPAPNVDQVLIIGQPPGADSIGDGIPDSWRAQYFPNVDPSGATANYLSCATCDADGTGQNNLFKYVAGLDPTNPASVFVLQIQNVAYQPTHKNLIYGPIANGCTYVVESTTNLVGGVWIPQAVSAPLTNVNQVTVMDANATTRQKFYRVNIYNVITNIVVQDSVGDGIPDTWRAQYFPSVPSNTTNGQSCATCDADGTGQDNFFKYVAGLDPTNPASVFVLNIANTTNRPSQNNLFFTPLALGRSYTPQFSTNLAGGVWLPLTTYTGLLTNGNQVTITDTNPIPPQEFYRIDISLP